jgi:DNA polymerase III alpha subunit
MDEIPALRVRTEFSFRKAFGPVPRVVAALKEMGCPAAAIVDGGTWGHVRWAKECDKQGVRPMFGTELVVPKDDGRKPVSWVLSEDMKLFYKFSTAARIKDINIEELFATSTGIIRFAGAGLENPDCFDYIDLNPASTLQNRWALRLHEKTGKPLVVTSDNAYPKKEDYDAFMAIIPGERATPQHLLRREELRASLRLLSDEQFDQACRNVFEISERCASKLNIAPLINVEGDLRQLAEEGKARRLALGHLASWPQHYEDRLQRELGIIENKNFESYFIVVADLVMWAKQHMLVGPGRGSSSGSILCYLLGITEIDSIEHGLLFERFVDVTRVDLPDIDIDFSDTKRDMCFQYLAKKYGSANVARIGNINTLKPRSVLHTVCKKFDVPDPEKFKIIDVLHEYSSGDSRFGKGLEDTLLTTNNGKEFLAKYPKAFVMADCENHAWHTGVHAAGVIVSNVAVNDYCTINPDGVAQIDKPDSEYLNLLKIDALGLRTLGIIEDTGVVTADELYALKLDDPKVFDIFNQKKYSCIFQFEGATQRTISEQIKVNDFKTIDHITALARPGPLGGGATEKYIERKAGRAPVAYRHEKLAPATGDTYGLIIYQEQVMNCVREIGHFSWEDTTIIRKAMSARKGKEFFDRKGELFVEGARQEGLSEADAKEIWQELCDFGAWGMNRSHTCAYAKISYWCAWLKAYKPLEFAAANLRNARDDINSLEILREMAVEGIEYIPFDIDLSEVHWSVKNGKLVGGFRNLIGFGPAKAVAAVEARRLGKMTEKLRTRIMEAKVKFTQLYPITDRCAPIYESPQLYGIPEGYKVLKGNQFPVRGLLYYITEVVAKSQRDENETLRIAKREGKRLGEDGTPTQFIDLHVIDDSGVPFTLRINRFRFVKQTSPYNKEPIGPWIMQNIHVGDVVLIRGSRIPNFNMISLERIWKIDDTFLDEVPKIVAARAEKAVAPA